MTEIECVECGRAFRFDPEERRRYAEAGYAPPRRCPPCRRARRRAREAAPPGTWASDSSPELDPVAPAAADEPAASEPAAAVEPRAGRGAAGAVTHEVQCSACGTLTRVPFAPTEQRPVYCAECFALR